VKTELALVTGASRGLGEGVARGLADQCKAVILTARDKSSLARVASEIKAAGGQALSVPCDVSDFKEVERAVSEARNRFGRLDILINNAGVIEPISDIAKSDPAIWARNITINVIGAYNVVRAVLPGMLAQGGGTIVNISSGAAYQPLEGWSAYCSSKSGLAMLTRSIALETASKGIRIFGFSPGIIDTDMQAKIRSSGINSVSKIPRDQLAPVEHAVRGILFLCSSGADDLIGQDVSIRHDSFRKRIGLARTRTQ
jgi:NAD(P)-dependent dehydrogenase (short-subunit alcohol dehydrogenase family)